MNLTVNEVEQFHEQGYVTFPALIAGNKLAHYKQILDELVERAKPMETAQNGFTLQPDEKGLLIPGRLYKVQGLCVEEPRMLGLAWESEITDRVTCLLGPHLHMFGSKFFPMLPHGGTSTGWHQDNHYFGTNSERVVSCGIYLEDSDRSNGCLKIIPRSHATRELAEHARGTGTLALGNVTEVDESRAVDLICPGGTVVLFSANLLHGAGTNTSARSRYSTAWHYIAADLDLEKYPFGEYRDRHKVR